MQKLAQAFLKTILVELKYKTTRIITIVCKLTQLINDVSENALGASLGYTVGSQRKCSNPKNALRINKMYIENVYKFVLIFQPAGQTVDSCVERICSGVMSCVCDHPLLATKLNKKYKYSTNSNLALTDIVR